MSEPIGVRYTDVHKSYRSGSTETSILRGVTFDVAPGEYIALMGPSGSGKSTLLNLTAGIDQPTAGKVTVGTQEPTTMSENDRSRWRSRTIGFIFQRYHLLDVLRAEENIETPLLLFGLSKDERQRRVKSALELVGLSDRGRYYPKQLSGGQEQRVAIARALVTDPSVMLADEPTGDLDAESAQSVLELLDMLSKLGKTLLVVTHDPSVARRAHRTLHLQKGIFTETPA